MISHLLSSPFGSPIPPARMYPTVDAEAFSTPKFDLKMATARKARPSQRDQLIESTILEDEVFEVEEEADELMSIRSPQKRLNFDSPSGRKAKLLRSKSSSVSPRRRALRAAAEKDSARQAAEKDSARQAADSPLFHKDEGASFTLKHQRAIEDLQHSMHKEEKELLDSTFYDNLRVTRSATKGRSNSPAPSTAAAAAADTTQSGSPVASAKKRESKSPARSGSKSPVPSATKRRSKSPAAFATPKPRAVVPQTPVRASQHVASVSASGRVLRSKSRQM